MLYFNISNYKRCNANVDYVIFDLCCMVIFIRKNKSFRKPDPRSG